MPPILDCAQGHRWEAESLAPAGARPVCPICGNPGAPARTMAPSAETLAAGQAPPLVVKVQTLSVFAQPPSPAVAPSSRPCVAGYEILDELGRGGMGVVYRARQVKLNRPVALKMILPGVGAGPRQLARFALEAEAAARLQHPNIIQVYEVGEQDGLPYLALELVEGGSLACRLAGASVPARQAARLLTALARAVHHAHQRGILHRDLKPANVLLAGEPGTPLEQCVLKITDFGLAKRLDDESGQTQTGAILGTPSYMAPEQAAGQTREIGLSADIYALGAILYELLTGLPPFQGATALEILEQTRSTEPVAPSRLQGEVPRDLNTVCLKCLHKAPSRRYHSAGELADDLDRFLAGEPIQARPVGLWERGLKWVRRRPAAAGLVAVSCLAVLALLAGGLWHDARLRAARDGAERDFQRTALRVVDVMLTEVAQKQLAHEPRMEDKRRELLDRAAQFCKEFLAKRRDDPLMRAEAALAYQRHADILRLLGEHGRAEQEYGRAIDLLSPLATDDPGRRRELAVCYNNLGEVLAHTGRPRESEGAYRHAADLQQALTKEAPNEPRSWRDLAHTSINLGILFGQTNRPTEAERVLRGAVQLIRDHPEMPDQGHYLGKVYLNLGPLLRRAGRPREARAFYDEAVKHLGELAEKSPENQDYRYALAVTYTNLGNVLAAFPGFAPLQAAYHCRAREMFQKLRNDHPKLRLYWQELANAYNCLGVLHLDTSLAEAARAWEQARRLLEPLAADRDSLPSHHADLGRTLGNLGWLHYAEKGQAEQGRLQQATAEALLGLPGNPVAWLALEFHHLNQARPLLEQAVRCLERALESNPDDPSSRETLRDHYQNLATVLLDLGEHGPAVRAAAGLARASPVKREDCYDAACFTARCVARADADPRLSPEQRRTLARQYADQAIVLLREAVVSGFADARALGKMREDAKTLLEPIAGRADFRQLVADLEKKARAGAGRPMP